MNAKLKPWGFEYLLYQNENVAIWHLFVDSGQQTSFHCHPRKKTGLVVLGDAAQVSFINSIHKLFAGDKLMIRPGVFHQTKNRGSCVLELLEIETPVNKSDIVRLRDDYGREGKPYGNEEEFQMSPITFPCQRKLCRISESDMSSLEEGSYMILSGGISHGEIKVAAPGDILDKSSVDMLLNEFDLLENTKALLIQCLI